MTDIKLFIDFICPFSYIGFSIADKLRKENLYVNIEYFPYELNPDAPPEGFDITEEIPEEELKEAEGRIRKLGSEYNLSFEYHPRSYNTHKLHKAALYAQDEGKFYEFAKEAFKAVFEKKENPSEDVVLNDIGLRAKINIVEMNRCLDTDIYEDKIEEAKKLINAHNIDSVPSFLVNDERVVTELKPYDEFKKDLLG